MEYKEKFLFKIAITKLQLDVGVKWGYKEVYTEKRKTLIKNWN